MNVQLTNLGVAALTAGGGQPITLTSAVIGSGYAYTPEPTDTNIHGSVLFTTVPSTPLAASANIVVYSVFMDTSVGPFQWGEFGLFMSNGQLFALGCSDTLIQKSVQTGSVTGNATRLDIYLSMVGTNYAMWLDLADSNSAFRIATVESIDYLPQSSNAAPNTYIVQSSETYQSSFLAYTDRQTLWNFDAYAISSGGAHTFTVVSATNTTVVINNSDYYAGMEPSYLGENIVQFVTGQDYSICRNVQTVTNTPTNTTITFATPLAVVPIAGDQFFYYYRDPLFNTNVSVNPATTSATGVVQVGAGLAVTDLGLLSVDAATIPNGVVTSINTYQGAVSLTANEIPNSVLSVNGQLPDGTGNVALSGSTYTLPIASATVLGGIKSSSQITVNATTGQATLAFSPVTAVNGVSGAVTLVGLITPTALANGTDLDTVTTSGLYYASTNAIATSLLNAPTSFSGGMLEGTLEVITLGTTPGGDLLQRWMQSNGVAWRLLISNSWTNWVNALVGGALPIASATQLGSVIVSGAGLSVDSNGNLAVIPATGAALGGVKINNSSLTVDSFGSLSVTPATTSVLGGVIVGSGLTVSSGTVSANVTSVNGSTGAIVVNGPPHTQISTLPTTPVWAFYEYTGGTATFTLLNTVSNPTWPSYFVLYNSTGTLTLAGALVGSNTVTISAGGLAYFQALTAGNYLVWGEINVT
jgi:hypothetical protein